FASGEQKQAIGGFAFYLRTLGLAALPWSAVIPPALWAGFVAFRKRTPVTVVDEPSREDEDPDHPSGSLAPLDASDRPSDPAGELHRLALLWFVISFGLITYSVTKYYHYLVPCLPPLAIMVGLWLHGLCNERESELRLPTPAVLACALAGCAILYMVGRATLHEPAWIAHLTTYLSTGRWRARGAPT